MGNSFNFVPQINISPRSHPPLWVPRNHVPHNTTRTPCPLAAEWHLPCSHCNIKSHTSASFIGEGFQHLEISTGIVNTPKSKEKPQNVSCNLALDLHTFWRRGCTWSPASGKWNFSGVCGVDVHTYNRHHGRGSVGHQWIWNVSFN